MGTNLFGDKINNLLTIFVSIAAIIVSIAAIFASIYSVKYNNTLREKVEIKLSQHESTSDIQDEMINALFEWDSLLNKLFDKYQSSDISVLSIEDKNKVNVLIEKINILLAKMFVITSDEQYKQIKDTITPDKVYVSWDLREQMLVTMRKIQQKDTKMEQKDIRFINKFN